MTLPAVNITVQDGNLGVVSTGSSACAVIGVSSTGTANLPTAITKVDTLTSTFGVGPGVEQAALLLSKGVPVLFIKATTATPGTAGAVTFTGTGTSVPTANTTTNKPQDTYEVYVEVATGGTVGTSGVKYRYSYDGGRNLSPAQSLGTSNTFNIPNVCDVALAAGTLVAGDTIAFRTAEPVFDGPGLLAAVNTYKTSAVRTRLVAVAGPMTAALGGVLDTALEEMAVMNKPRRWIGNTRIPNVGESDAAYQTAMQATSTAYSTKRGALCAGAADLVSAVSGREYLRPISFRVAAEEGRAIALGNEESDIADLNLGSLVGTSVSDVNGNPKTSCHDEFVSPGLDDQRYITLRTWPTFAGVYVTNPRLFSPEGSDFQFIPHGLIMDIAQETAYANLALRLNRPVLVDSTTGHIHESDAQEIEAGCEKALEAVLLAKPKASAVNVTVSRTDDILATKTLTVSIQLVPLGYITTINVSIGFAVTITVAA